MGDGSHPVSRLAVGMATGNASLAKFVIIRVGVSGLLGPFSQKCWSVTVGKRASSQMQACPLNVAIHTLLLAQERSADCAS